MMKVYNCITVNRWVKRLVSVFLDFSLALVQQEGYNEMEELTISSLIQIHEQLKLHLIMFPIKPCL